MVEDCNVIGQYCPEYYNMGVGVGNLMIYGVFNYPEYKEIYYTGQDVYIDGKAEKFDPMLINEDIQKSWYTAEHNINIPEGPYTEEDLNKQTQYQIPVKVQGSGLVDTTRGALGHWLTIDNKVIKNYSIITPSAWNLSPQGNAGIRGL